MPFLIVRNDIVNMQVDAVVNTANPQPVVGCGVDAGVHKAAGPQLLEARRRIGYIPVGQARITPGFGLKARYVIHAVGPVWDGGGHHEVQLLEQCYAQALALAQAAGCASVAFPLLCAGNHGFPKELALQTAVNAFSRFLLAHDMQIYLVVFGAQALALSEKLFEGVSSYIDEHYIQNKNREEYGVSDKSAVRESQQAQLRRAMAQDRAARLPGSRRALYQAEELLCAPAAPSAASDSAGMPDLDKLLAQQEDGFSQTLLRLIDRTGKKDSEIYKKANVDRKLFSKIRSNPAYKPSKVTALAFALALELDLDDTRTLLGRAGYALTRSSKFDIIVEYFILQKNYNVYELNEVLFRFDQPLIFGD